MLRIGRGPRATTTALLDDLDQILVTGRSPDLGRSIRILVPSKALKRQLGRKIIERFAGSVLGLEIQTPLGLTQTILAQSPSSHESDPGIAAILVKRQANKYPELHRLLSNFHDGFALCASAVSDLLSAGLDDNARVDTRKRLDSLDQPDLKKRGQEILELALSSAKSLHESGLSRTSDRFLRAQLQLEESDAFAQTTAHLFVFGFSDAPGRTQQFIRTLLEKTESTYYLDLPPEATNPQSESTGCFHARSFARGLGFDPETIEAETPRRSTLATWQGISSVGTGAEVREIAGLISERLAAGASPLELGVVVRDMEAYLPEIRRQFDQQGIPFATESLPRGFHPAASRFGALCEGISRGAELPLDRFIELLNPSCSSFFTHNQVQKLDLFLRDQNLQTVNDFCSCSLNAQEENRETRGLSFTAGIDRESDRLQKKKSQLKEETLRAALTMARDLKSWHQDQPQEQKIEQWIQQTRAFLIDKCSWQEEKDSQKILEHLREFEAKFSDISLEVTRLEFRQLFERQLDSLLTTPTSPSKNGVAILPLEKARSLTFESAYVLGVNRGSYPRFGHEDPLLNDTLRSCFRFALPSLGQHADRSEEESYLFAQLMECADHITLSWQRANSMGKTCARSPFIDRLQLDKNAFPVRNVPREFKDVLAAEKAANRPILPQDAMVWAGLTGTRQEQNETKNDFLRTTGSSTSHSEIPSQNFGEALTQLITEIDPHLDDPDERKRLTEVSPFFGHTGRDTLQNQKIYVTTLEQSARCPWQVFVKRTLGCEEAPDPWEQLPELDTLIVGNTVHKSLERLYAENIGTKNHSRPEESRIARATQEAALEELKKNDIRLAGFESILFEVSLPFVTRAIDLEWEGEKGPQVIATESTGKVAAETSDGKNCDVFYRVDREDILDNKPLLTDYKTGKPISEGARESTREKHFIKAFKGGKLLQGAAYALGSEGVGRYLFLRPDVADEHAVLTVANDETTRSRFEAVTKRLLDSWHQGTFPPRLEESDGTTNKNCDYCSVRSACLQNDSGAKRRLSQLAHTEEEETPSLLADLWNLSGYVTKQLENQS